MKRQAITWVLLILWGLAVNGCASMHAILPTTVWRHVHARNEGYSLLYQLMSQESDVAKILIVKDTAPPVTVVIKEISKACGEAKKQMDSFAKADRYLKLKTTDLPKIEQQTRDAIASTEARDLLFSTGKTFQRRLLFTQAEAMNYASHLAGVLHDQERDPERRKFLETLSQQCATFHGRVNDLLNSAD